MFCLGVLQAADFKNSATLAVSTKSGNTNVMTYSVGFASESVGNINLFNIPLEDSELSFSIAHAKGSYQEELLENKGRLNLIFDYHANRTFSPFIFLGAEYDSLASLDSRSNVGLGAKWRFNSALSLSVAGLFEREKYINSSSTSFGRLSIRPKYKRSFESGISVLWIYFYQPALNDFSNYLMNHSMSISIKTKLEWLAITLTATDTYNSNPPVGTDKRDVTANLGFTANF